MTDTEVLGSGTLHGGVASFKTSKLNFGRNSIRAEYFGDSEFGSTRVEDESAVGVHTVN